MNNRQTLVQEQFAELANKYPGLVLTSGDGSWMIRGVLEFLANYDGVSIRDTFNIELSIAGDYPETLPLTRETGGRIPKDFHTNPDESLCLGAPLELRMKFKKNGTLLGFVDEQVIPFLFSFCYFQQHGRMPFGELPHGGEGIVEYYTDLFKVASNTAAVELLKVIAEDNYKGHLVCPCKSGKRLRDCHGAFVRDISAYQSRDDFLHDYVRCLTHLKETGQKLSATFINKTIIKRFKRFLQEDKR